MKQGNMDENSIQKSANVFPMITNVGLSAFKMKIYT